MKLFDLSKSPGILNGLPYTYFMIGDQVKVIEFLTAMVQFS